MRHRIEFADEADEHLAGLRARDRAIVIRLIEEQLLHEPAVPTRNRKRMRPNPIAPWVLRAGHLRVYYDVAAGTDPIVTVRAIGIKVRKRVTIGGEEVELS